MMVASVYAVWIEYQEPGVPDAAQAKERWRAVARYADRASAEARLADENAGYVRARVRGTSRSTTRPARKRVEVESYLVTPDGRWFPLGAEATPKIDPKYEPAPVIADPGASARACEDPNPRGAAT